MKTLFLLILLTGVHALADIPRTPDGKPDLSGTYDIATLTPLERRSQFGDNQFLTPEEAQEIADADAKGLADNSSGSDPNRGAPPDGGDGSPGAAGNVGGYNTFWIDNGDGYAEFDGKFRTSIVYDPANGRRPDRTEASKKRNEERRKFYRPNIGEAGWLELDGPGPYDHPESRPLAERCILGLGSTAGPPMMPVLYNNLKRIGQTPDTIMILIEMNHDARIIRMNSEHVSSDVRKWLGDSIGYWEGDTLVVDTTNFTDRPSLSGATRDLHVVERFKLVDENTILYSFTVDDPGTWTAPWSGEYPWPKSDNSLYEYACHEGNYALGNIMRGARLLEADVLKGKQTSDGAE